MRKSLFWSPALALCRARRLVCDSPATFLLVGCASDRRTDRSMNILCCASDRRAVGGLSLDSIDRPQSPVVKSRGFGGKELSLIDAWIARREEGDLEGAVSFCASNIVVVPPAGGEICGIDQVKATVFVKAAQPPTKVMVPLQAKEGEPGCFYREVLFTALFMKAVVRQEWCLANTGRDGLKITKITLTRVPQ